MKPHKKPAEGVKISLTLKAVHQNCDCRVDRWLTEILQSGPAPCLGAKPAAIQKPQVPADVIAQRCATFRPKIKAPFRRNSRLPSFQHLFTPFGFLAFEQTKKRRVL
jgi:hypothetical protein